ncbi:MAG: cytochrome c oxidase assembly protein [Enhygromyxa sp.]
MSAISLIDALAHAAPWSGELPAPLGLACLAGLYGLGLARLWRRAGIGRGVRRWQVGCFVAALATLVASLLSPIATLSEELLWVHMIQHLLLMLVAAPLLMAASPGLVVAWALPRRWRVRLARLWVSARRRAPGGLAWHPVVAWLAFALVLWIWHLPLLYQAALEHPRVHDLQHLAFFGAACLYWRAIFEPIGRARLGPVALVAYVFTTSLHGMLLGVLVALSPRLWYPIYEQTTANWGLAALEDQQLAGFIMWMPACGVYAIIAVGALVVWLHRAQRDAG